MRNSATTSASEVHHNPDQRISSINPTKTNLVHVHRSQTQDVDQVNVASRPLPPLLLVPRAQLRGAVDVSLAPAPGHVPEVAGGHGALAGLLGDPRDVVLLELVAVAVAAVQPRHGVDARAAGPCLVPLRGAGLISEVEGSRAPVSGCGSEAEEGGRGGGGR